MAERVDGCVGSLDSDTVSLRQSTPPPDQLHQNNPLLCLPILAMERILDFLSYEEIGQLRLVCKHLDIICQPVLNQGFWKVKHFVSLKKRQVKAQILRSKLKRINYPLLRKYYVLSDVQKCLVCLNRIFMKYIDSNLCCFFPGKVLDETYRVLRYMNSIGDAKFHVAEEYLSSTEMAIMYFYENIFSIVEKKLL